MRYSLLARIGSVVLLALIGALAVATVRADDPDAWEFVDLWVEVRKEARAEVIEFRLAGDGLTARTGTPENRFVRVHEGWLHYWLPGSPITVRPGLRARIVARLVEQPYLTVKLSGSVTGSVGLELFGTGVKASGGVGLSSEALRWELEAQMVRIGLQLSFNGGAWTEPLEFKRRFHYEFRSICVTDFPGLDKLDEEIEIAGVTVKRDDLCIGDGLRSDRWSRTDELTIPAQLSMFPESGVPAATGTGAISAGWWHSCAIAHGGSIACWGNNYDGQTDAPEGTFSQVSAGAVHTCAIDTNSSISCWGSNNRGQTDAPDGSFSQLSSGDYHTCAIALNGSISCWGWNDYRQIDEPNGTFSQISGGHLHTCAIASNGSISCWGWNDWGQTDSLDGTFSQVSSGGNHTCAIATDGSISCWGANHAGLIDAPDGTISQFSAGNDHTCAIATDGSISCWGRHNDHGQTDAPNGSFSQVSVGYRHTCAIATDGSVSCWGRNSEGQTDVPQNLRRPNAVSQ